MSFFSRVLFPAPDGPLITTGRGPAIAAGEAKKRVWLGKQVGEARGMKRNHWNLSAWVTTGTNLSAQTLYDFKKDFRGLKRVSVFRQALLRWDKRGEAMSQMMMRPKHLPQEHSQSTGYHGAAEEQLLANWTSQLVMERTEQLRNTRG